VPPLWVRREDQALVGAWEAQLVGMASMEEPVKGGMAVESVCHPVYPYQRSVVSLFSLLHCGADPGQTDGSTLVQGVVV
jgi:hypothetical protein